MMMELRRRVAKQQQEQWSGADDGKEDARLTEKEGSERSKGGGKVFATNELIGGTEYWWAKGG